MDSSLKYNIRWVERTFTTPSATEVLLSPERESGNLTSHDYDAALDFLPGYHRHYRLIGGIMTIPLLYAFRKPNWNNVRSYSFLVTTSLAGFVIGHALSIYAHVNFVRSIENPAGFSQAMENIQKNTGSFTPPGPLIIRQGGKWTFDHDSHSPPQDAVPVTYDPVSSTEPTRTPAPIKPMSRWDQIRAVNSPIRTNSSWDTLRQSHERVRVSTPSPLGGDEYSRPRDEDREAEQAEFDELLERERRIK